jgi:hypothetical protein
MTTFITKVDVDIKDVINDISNHIKLDRVTIEDIVNDIYRHVKIDRIISRPGINNIYVDKEQDRWFTLGDLITRYLSANNIRKILDTGYVLRLGVKHPIVNICRNPDYRCVIKLMYERGQNFNNVTRCTNNGSLPPNIGMGIINQSFDENNRFEVFDALIDHGMDILKDIKYKGDNISSTDMFVRTIWPPQNRLVWGLYLIKRGARSPSDPVGYTSDGIHNGVIPQHHGRLMHAIRLTQSPFSQVHKEMKHRVVDKFSNHIFPREIIERIARHI